MKNNTLIVSSFIILCFSSCSRKLNDESKMNSVLPFHIECETSQHIPQSGMDSEIGTLICDNYTFQYDYGRYSNSQPISLYESFSKKFYAFHYSKFFEAIFVEEKVREVLKDSITILEVDNQRLEGKYIVDCTNCNATAKLSFADNTFLYAFNPSTKVIDNEIDYSINIEELVNGYYKKTFISKNENIQGVYIAPTGNFAKSRMKNRLSITCKEEKSDQLKTILNSIYLK